MWPSHFWIPVKYLELYTNKLCSVKSVLYTRIECWVWIQVQTIKNLNFKIEFMNEIQHLEKST